MLTAAANPIRLRIVAELSDGRVHVSELARRLNLSDYFSNVVLLPGKQEKEAGTGLNVVRFQLEAQVKY